MLDGILEGYEKRIRPFERGKILHLLLPLLYILLKNWN